MQRVDIKTWSTVNKAQEELAILDLKSILALVPQDISMRSLTVAIRQYCLQHQVAHLREHYLKFFLKCETKLSKQTNQEWNRVVHGQLKKIVSAQKMNAFIANKLVQSGWNCILRLSFLSQQSLAEETLNDQFAELKDMQISQDVRVKTKYFFIWTQFLASHKEIKRLKNKEIEDIKKSKTFNQYTTKFNFFRGLKLYVRKMKTIREKATVLQNKKKNTQLTAIMGVIKEKIEIIGIEKKLQETVSEKLEVMQVASVFKKLQIEKQKCLLFGERLNKTNNIYLHRFYLYLTGNLRPLLNAASIQSRSKIADQYRQACLVKSWKGLKQLRKLTMSKVGQIKTIIKMAGLKDYAQIAQFKTNARSKTIQIKALEKHTQFKQLTELIKEKGNRELNFIECNKKVQNILMKGSSRFMLKQLIQLRTNRQQIQTKLRDFYQLSVERSKRKVYAELTNFKEKAFRLRAQTKELRSCYLINLLKSRLRCVREWKEDGRNLKDELAGLHQKYLMKQVWKGLHKIDDIKEGEKETFSSLFKLIELKILQDAFSHLKQQTTSSMNLDKLFKKTEFVVTKISFVTILNRMLSKKMKIKSFAAKQELKLKQKLFNLLISNSELLETSGLKARGIYVKVMKKKLLRRLNSQVTLRYDQNDVQSMIQENSKKAFFKKFRIFRQTKVQYQEGEEKVGTMIKQIRFQQMLQNVQYLIDDKKEEEAKELKIAKKIVKNYLKCFRKNVKQREERRQSNKLIRKCYDKHINQIQTGLAGKALQKMVRQNQLAVKRKYQILKHKQQLTFLKLFKCNQKTSLLKLQLASSRAVETITRLRDHKIMKSKVCRVSSLFLSANLRQSFLTLQENVRIESEQMQRKSELVSATILGMREQKSKDIFISKLKNHLELKENITVLVNQRLKSNCRELLKTHLKQKSKGLKEYMALRYHATNVKRRAMRALKYIVAISLLKQNKTSTDHSSKVLMQRRSSIDNVKKKSKLIETIERYNMSRVSRVIR